MPIIVSSLTAGTSCAATIAQRVHRNVRVCGSRPRAANAGRRACVRRTGRRGQARRAIRRAWPAALFTSSAENIPREHDEHHVGEDAEARLRRPPRITWRLIIDVSMPDAPVGGPPPRVITSRRLGRSVWWAILVGTVERQWARRSAVPARQGVCVWQFQRVARMPAVALGHSECGEVVSDSSTCMHGTHSTGGEDIGASVPSGGGRIGWWVPIESPCTRW